MMRRGSDCPICLGFLDDQIVQILYLCLSSACLLTPRVTPHGRASPAMVANTQGLQALKKTRRAFPDYMSLLARQ